MRKINGLHCNDNNFRISVSPGKGDRVLVWNVKLFRGITGLQDEPLRVNLFYQG